MTKALRDTPEEWTGPRRFDEFEVVRPLGHGGMGQVLLGRDLVLDRPVALKFTTADNPSPAVRARFLQEARGLARLSHPNVVGIYRIGEAQGRPYIAYEFVAGQTLDRLRAPMPWARVARIALGIARGLAAAHGAGVLHRDVKPGNVMLTDGGEVKLLDFGLARLGEAPQAAPATGVDAETAVDPSARTMPGATRARTGEVQLTHAGSVMGTPLYMPPEIWRREPATARSDLYAFGLVVYELLTGTLPHGGHGRELSVDAVLLINAPPVAARCRDVLPSFAAVVDACLRRAPEDRPESAEVVAKTLERLCALFLPAQSAAASQRDDGDPEVVAGSLGRALTRGDALSRGVYDRLFLARPELRTLFPSDLDGQRQKLQQAIQLSVEALGDHERLLPVLLDLGRRHARYRLDLADYQAVGEALFAALGELDAAWSTEVESAWRRAWTFVVNGMRRGETAEASAHHTRTGSASEVAVEARRPPSGPSSLKPPPTRYAYVGELGIAYQVFGLASLDLLLHFGRVSHLDYAWRHPRMADFLRTFGSMSRVITFDRRGTGLSERVLDPPRLQERIEDILAVLDAAGSQQAVILGVGEGASAALLFAATFPERARAVVCINGAARLLKAPDFPGGLDPAFLDAACERVRRHWGEPLFAEAEAPSLAGDVEFCAWFGEYLRSSSSPGHVVAQLRLNARYDARVFLPFVRVPTLVLHRSGNTLAPLANGRSLAEGVAGARFVELPGSDHLPFAGDTVGIFREVERFLHDPRLDAPPPRPLRTLVLLRAERPDAPLLASARERFVALGAHALSLEDPCAVLYASPWFASVTDVTTQLVAMSGAADQGLRAALHAGLVDLHGAGAPEVTAALCDVVARLAPATCAASSLVASLCVATSVAFDGPVEPGRDDALGFVFARRAR